MDGRDGDGREKKVACGGRRSFYKEGRREMGKASGVREELCGLVEREVVFDSN